MQYEDDLTTTEIKEKNCDKHSPSGLITSNGLNGIRGCPSAVVAKLAIGPRFVESRFEEG